MKTPTREIQHQQKMSAIILKLAIHRCLVANIKSHILLVINFQDKGANIYCHDMNTYYPKEYLTLPQGPEENLSFTVKTEICTNGKHQYEKIGLNLTVSKKSSMSIIFFTDARLCEQLIHVALTTQT